MSYTDLAAKVCETQDCDLYFYNGEMSRNGYKQVSSMLVRKEKMKKNAVLILGTYGGDPDAAFRIARAFKHYYEKFTIIIGTNCKSAGTLLCVGADELVISNFGELGPLDIQLSKPDELFETSSGLNLQQAISFLETYSVNTFRMLMIDLKVNGGLSTKIATDVASNLTAGLYSPIYSQIDPVKAGEVQRAMQIALKYGQKLDDKAKNLTEGGLDRLVMQYPSHAFVIDRKEAKRNFKNVRNVNKEESDLLDEIWSIIEDGCSNSPPIVLDFLPKTENKNTKKSKARKSTPIPKPVKPAK